VCDWQVVDVTYGLFVWPCAPLLAKYVFYYQDYIAQKHILEVCTKFICAFFIDPTLLENISFNFHHNINIQFSIIVMTL